jgi:hypothetical protein
VKLLSETLSLGAADLLRGLVHPANPSIKAYEQKIATAKNQPRRSDQSNPLGRCARHASVLETKIQIKSTTDKMVEAINQNCDK